MSPGGFPGGRRRKPGGLAPRPGSRKKKHSFHYERDMQYLDRRGAVICTKIYFHTNEWDLTTDSRGALYKTVKTMRTLLVYGAGVDMWCRGHADVRGEEAFNRGLSEKRIASVEHLLKNRLGYFRFWKLLKGDPKGEKGSRNSPVLWAEDRRVDVIVRAETEAARDARANPGPRIRAEIFRENSPVYHLWVRLGLDYLIDDYEDYDEHEEIGFRYPVNIKPGDLENAFLLVLTVADPSDQKLLKQWAKGSMRADVIADAYCIEYRKAYHEAHKIYTDKL